jgi:hypothetical protein
MVRKTSEPVEFSPRFKPVDGTTFDLMQKFSGLRDNKSDDRRAVAAALGRLLCRALEALLREEATKKIESTDGQLDI